MEFGGPVTVVGANEIGLNAAAFAVQQGKPTVVVTGGKSAGWDMNPILAAHTIGLLQRAGVTFVDADPGGSASRVLAHDWVADERPVEIPGKEVIEVGAKVKGGRLYQATQSGFWSGTRI